MRVTKAQLGIVGLLLLFALLAWVGASNQSATYDEPLHIASAMAMKQRQDFRIDSEDPAGFKQWLAMFLPDQPLPAQSPFWEAAGKDPPAQWAWAVQTLFDQPAENALAAIDRGRLAMLVLGVALGALIAVWAYELGGPAAGLIAAALFAFDPNFLAHSVLAKNDVVAALGYTATAYAAWRLGRRATATGVIALGLAVAFTVTMKFSGVLLAAIVPMLLFARAILLHLPAGEWAGVRGETSETENDSNAIESSDDLSAEEKRKSTDASLLTPNLPPPLSFTQRLARLRNRFIPRYAEGSRAADSRSNARDPSAYLGMTEPVVAGRDPSLRKAPPARAKALFAALGMTLAVAAISYGAIWFCYGFRYAPSPDAAYSLDVASQSPNGKLLPTIDRLHLLPQSYAFGLAYTLNSTAHRDNFLLGEISSAGHWYYFPIAMAVKTPLATIGLGLLAVFAGIRFRATSARAGRGAAGLDDEKIQSPRPIAGGAENAATQRRTHLWTIACLAIPAGVYLAMAMRSNLNIGLRHVLPIYPVAFIAIAGLVARYRKLSTLLLLLLLMEAGSAFPNELSFFNLQLGERRPMMGYLSDSNLDWGQGLKQLANWQAANEKEKLYLSYFGTAPPAAYGVDATYVFAGYAYGTPPVMPTTPGVLAISITQLQGLYVSEEMKPTMEKIRRARLRQVIGGSICLYDWPLTFGSR